MLNKRANILFENTTWGVLQQVAQTKQVSVSQLVRAAVKKMYLEQAGQNKRQKTLAAINQLAAKVDTEGLDYQELINHGRRF